MMELEQELIGGEEEKQLREEGDGESEEEDDDFEHQMVIGEVHAQDLSSLRNDDEMGLSEEEILAAYTIKLAIQSANEEDEEEEEVIANADQEEEDDDDSDSNEELSLQQQQLRPLSHYEYVQYALCTHLEEDTTPEKIIERISVLQAFRDEYNIQDTVEEGMELIDAFTRLIPGFFLHFEKIQPENIVLMVTHWAALDVAKIKANRGADRLFLGSMYYSLQLRMCNFHAIRTGSRLVAEFGGAGMNNFCDDIVYHGFFHCLYVPYPWNPEKTFFINTPGAFNIIFNSYKRYMTPAQRDRSYVGYQIPGLDQGEQIDSLYKTPTEEIGRQRMLTNARLLLQERYNNQTNFVLPE